MKTCLCMLLLCAVMTGCTAINFCHQLIDPAQNVQIIISSPNEVIVGVGGDKVTSNETGAQLAKMGVPKRSPILLVHDLGEEEQLIKNVQRNIRKAGYGIIFTIAK